MVPVYLFLYSSAGLLSAAVRVAITAHTAADEPPPHCPVSMPENHTRGGEMYGTLKAALLAPDDPVVAATALTSCRLSRRFAPTPLETRVKHLMLGTWCF